MKIKRLVVGGLTLSLLLTGNFTFAKNSSAETVNVSKNFTGWKIENGVNYFYQNGVKFTGQGATRYFVNGRYANQFVTINGVSYFYQNGLKFTGQGATRYFVNGRYANQFITINGVSYFYQNGLKFTGQGATRYFVNGRYANQFVTINGVSYFYQNGLKFTGQGATRYFVNGRYANGWQKVNGEWFYYSNGLKFTGVATDYQGTHNFENGKIVKRSTGNNQNGRPSAEYYIKGNKKSMIYHLPGQRFYDEISPENIEWFKSEEDAIRAGYRKSKI